MRIARSSSSQGVDPRSRFGIRRGQSLRGQILLAFLTMSVITGALGYFSISSIEHEGRLVDRTFDRALMSINFARAADADFKYLLAMVGRRAYAVDAEARSAFDKHVDDLEAEMGDDLSVAVQRAQSNRAIAVGTKIQAALSAWKAAKTKVLADARDKSAWSDFDEQASKVTQELDLLINYTAGDGFTYRQSAHATVRADRRLNFVATALAVLISGAIALLLSRQLLAPINRASKIATQIADGDLSVSFPAGRADELGQLLAAMEVMRGNIKASMDREVELRCSAQMRLAAALEGSYEGIVVTDADGRIALANAQASRLIGADREQLNVGDPIESIDVLLKGTDGNAAIDQSVGRDIELADGRWLRISRSRTREGGSVFIFGDVSLIKQQQVQLKTTNLWLDAALANLSQGLCLFDAANTLKVYNQRFCDIFGLPAAKVRQGIGLEELVELGFGTGIRSQLLDGAGMSAGLGPGAARRPIEHLVELGQGRTIAVSRRPIEEQSWLVTYEDVTDRLKAAEKISYMARHDALTRLPNRAFFLERIEAAVASTDDGKSFALLCIDLDRFKEINDTLGHPIGDALLIAVAGRLSGTVRANDLVSRLGGDEFAIIQTIEAANDAAELALRIIAALEKPFEIEGNPLTIGASIGVSLAPTDGRSYQELLKNADLALYRAKEEGRNRWHFFEQRMDEQHKARRLLELDLRQAVERDEFELEYQPLIEIASGRIRGFEALLRWRHPNRGSVPPNSFIPIAEDTGLIVEIGDAALRRACREAARWPDDVSVAVNVSGAQLRHGRLLDSIENALGSSSLTASRLILEITESVLIANAKNARALFERCKEMGIRLAMDDFGTGYSSLSYLRSFPFDSVKIDKSFISEVATNSEAAAIVHAIVALCKRLGMRTTAEGVETEAQLSFLRAEGCDAAQGFLFSRPVGRNVVPSLLEAQNNAPICLIDTKAA